MLWDIGTFEWIKESAEDVERSRLAGDIKFRLSGSKLSGEFALVHIGERGRQYGGSSDGSKNWLMLKNATCRWSTDSRRSTVMFRSRPAEASRRSRRDGGGDPREMRRARATGRNATPRTGGSDGGTGPRAGADARDVRRPALLA